jgi:hypothetical protein
MVQEQTTIRRKGQSMGATILAIDDSGDNIPADYVVEF